jgi:hypothetical protein
MAESAVRNRFTGRPQPRRGALEDLEAPGAADIIARGFLTRAERRACARMSLVAAGVLCGGYFLYQGLSRVRRLGGGVTADAAPAPAI